ncbi:MAG: hypothetical protein AB2651_22040 [Candidatus Thiodiazotropha sp.]
MFCSIYSLLLWDIITSKYKERTGDDPLGHVVSLNVHRRHLDESQRAMVGAKIAQFEVGQNQYTAGSANLPTQLTAAEQLNVSERSIRTAKNIQKEGAPELIEAVDKGDVCTKH